jgi:hypothetical protein
MELCNMFTKEQFEGISLAMATPEITVERSNTAAAGYRVKLRIHFRCRNFTFLEDFQTYLKENDIDSLLKDSEGSHRPYPLLRISKPENLRMFLALIPDLPDANDRFGCFEKVLSIYEKGSHMTQKGLDKVLEIKGYML